MEQNIKIRLLESIGQVYELSKDSKLDAAFFEILDVELKHISDYFKVSRNQSLIIAMVFVMNYKGDTVDLKDLIDHFQCNPMKLLEFSDDFDTLFAKGILKKQISPRRFRLALSSEQFTINETITEAILNNKPMPDVNRQEVKDGIELLEKLIMFGKDRDDDAMTTFELFAQTKELISTHLHFPLIKKIHDYEFDIKDTYLLVCMIWETISGSETTDIGRTTTRIFDNPSERINYIQKILSGDNQLVRQNFVEIVESDFFNDTELKLSESSLKMLQEFGLRLFANKKRRNSILEPGKINPKVLYFNESERKQLDLLKTLLEEDNFRQTQLRLQSKGFPKGITALLHGLPGTGKTETVLQVAKDTNREIVKVDISQSKSMWFGESEKIIKSIFRI